MNIAGNKYLVDFGSAKAILYFKTTALLSFTITQQENQQVNITEAVAIKMLEIRPALLMVSWKEKTGVAVTQVQDYEKGIVYSNWVSPEGGITQLQGTLTHYQPLKVQTSIKSSIDQCWQCWTNPADILLFNKPFNNWHTAKVQTDLKEAGRFFYRMESLDGKEGFDFAGTYNAVLPKERIELTGDDGRKTIQIFSADGDQTIITEIFEPDTTTPLALQQEFCQTILDNFKRYMEQ